jgi:hypothetical protein
MKNMANIFDESNLYISKDEKDDSDDPEEEGNKWIEIEHAHP